MTTERIKGQLSFVCDSSGCSEFFEPSTNDFEDGWAEAKEQGWVASKSGKEWFHKCPTCVLIPEPKLPDPRGLF